MNSTPIKIACDGTVFALAEQIMTARTGVFFVLKNLIEALSAREDVELHFFVPEEFNGMRELPALLAKALRSLRLREDPFAPKRWNLGVDKINYFMGYHPPLDELHKMPNSKIYLMFHDFAYHACPEFRQANPEFEKWRDIEKWQVSGLGETGHAFCVSQCTQNDLYKYFNFPLARSSVIYPAARPNFTVQDTSAESQLRVREALKIPAGAAYIFALSTLQPKKNLATSLKAFGRVVEKLTDQEIYFVISGTKGELDPSSFFNMVSPFLARRVIYTDYVPDDALPALFSNALCLVYPSLYEGFGLPPLEAMTLGTPVIVSNRGALPETVGPGGKIVDAYDDEAIAETILRWARDPNERQKWSKLGREHARKFSWEASASKVVETMRSAL